MVLPDIDLKLPKRTRREVTSRDINYNHKLLPSEQTKRKSTLLRDSLLGCASSWHSLKQRLSTSGSFFSTPSLSALSVGNDSVFFSDSYYDAVHTTIGLCRDYVVFRLQRSGFGYKLLADDYPPAKDQLLSSRILRAGKFGFNRLNGYYLKQFISVKYKPCKRKSVA